MFDVKSTGTFNLATHSGYDSLHNHNIRSEKCKISLYSVDESNGVVK